MRKCLIISLHVAILLGCSSTVLARQASQGAETELADTSWELVRFQGGDAKALAPDEKGKYTIAFDHSGNIAARIDCNRGRGTWKVPGPNQIEFGPLALTRAMCPPAPLNDRIARDWALVRSYVIKDRHLFLSLMADGGTYEFEPLGAASDASEPAISSLPASFVGNLPCADCPGIRYQVNLFADHTFASRMSYLERETDFTDHGSWQIAGDGKTVVLLGERGAREQFALRDADTLHKLDSEGHEIESKFDYDLKRLAAFAPIETQGQQDGAVALEDTHWKLAGLGEATITAASQQQEPYLVLDSKTGRVAGSGGCNRLTGSYHLNGDRLTFEGVAGTMMACIEGMDTETAFLNVLTHVQRWKISGQQMELYDGSGNVVARFVVGSTK